MRGFFDLVPSLRRLCPALVDLRWIALAPWREQVRAVFDKPPLLDRLDALEEIEIVATAPQDEWPPSLFLLAGWILDRLQLDPVACTAGSIECRRPRGGDVRVVLRVEAGQVARVTSIVMTGREGVVVRILRKEALETIVEGPYSYRWSQLLDEDSSHALLERYFLVGESTANYRGALQVAQQLVQLRRAYAG
jgi:glucose-6-phosphate dehydrogenase assembly protein OpcA